MPSNTCLPTEMLGLFFQLNVLLAFDEEARFPNFVVVLIIWWYTGLCFTEEGHWAYTSGALSYHGRIGEVEKAHQIGAAAPEVVVVASLARQQKIDIPEIPFLGYMSPISAPSWVNAKGGRVILIVWGFGILGYPRTNSGARNDFPSPCYLALGLPGWGCGKDIGYCSEIFVLLEFNKGTLSKTLLVRA